MQRGDAAQPGGALAVGLGHVDHAPVAQVGRGQGGDLGEGLLVVERPRQRGAGRGQERGALLGELELGAGLALGGEGAVAVFGGLTQGGVQGDVRGRLLLSLLARLSSRPLDNVRRSDSVER